MSKTQRGPNDRPRPTYETFPNDPDTRYPVTPAPEPVDAPEPDGSTKPTEDTPEQEMTTDV